jgi:uncharacterized membrane protein
MKIAKKETSSKQKQVHSSLVHMRVLGLVESLIFFIIESVSSSVLFHTVKDVLSCVVLAGLQQEKLSWFQKGPERLAVIKGISVRLQTAGKAARERPCTIVMFTVQAT